MTNLADYVFHNVPAQLTPLQEFLDPFTRGELAEMQPSAGGHFLDLGAGGGSVTRMLSELAGENGRVDVIDQDTHMVPEGPNIEIHTQDLSTGEPLAATGPFDLVHGRLLTHHLENRVEFVHRLAGSLKPGGWLLLGEFVRSTPRVVSAPSEEHAAVFKRVLDGLYDVMTARHTHGGWGHEVHQTMLDAGLSSVRTRWHFESWTGGGYGCRLYENNVSQKRDAMIEAGFDAADIDFFLKELMHDEAMVVRSHEFVSIRGRRV
ncbi:trans-aconitate 2-methyltransferase [Streptomyces albus]|uniref:class I SAM-dependent methyltransferase n=1 Tax=Streptomyces albus TaxID=1888 RepID=UPI0006925772|nr:class I SAM-dependent methyltransferase [Streptomyces albus]